MRVYLLLSRLSFFRGDVCSPRASGAVLVVWRTLMAWLCSSGGGSACSSKEPVGIFVVDLGWKVQTAAAILFGREPLLDVGTWT